MILIDRGYWNAYLNVPYIHNGVGEIGDTYTVKVESMQDIGNSLTYYRIGQRLTLCDDLIYRLNVESTTPPTPEEVKKVAIATVGSANRSAVISYAADGTIVDAYDTPISGIDNSSIDLVSGTIPLITSSTGPWYGTSAIPSGKTKCFITPRNITNPDTPFVNDNGVFSCMYKIAGTVLTITAIFFNITALTHSQTVDSWTFDYIVV